MEGKPTLTHVSNAKGSRMSHASFITYDTLSSTGAQAYHLYCPARTILGHNSTDSLLIALHLTRHLAVSCKVVVAMLSQRSLKWAMGAYYIFLLTIPFIPYAQW